MPTPHRKRRALGRLGLFLGLTSGLCLLQGPAALPQPTAPRRATFVNAFGMQPAPDPWIVRRDGYYYFTFTAGDRIEIWRARTLKELRLAGPSTVWEPPIGLNRRELWAPELHFLDDRCYLYYTATSGGDANRRIYALESAGQDPLGPYFDRQKLDLPDDRYAIDGTVWEKDGERFFLWSGRPNDHRPEDRENGNPQNLYLARMDSPLRVSGSRTLISTPEYRWEREPPWDDPLPGQRPPGKKQDPNNPYWWVNEGPEILHGNGNTFVLYSASHSKTDEYCLGMLRYLGGNPLEASSWRKHPVPVFQKYTEPGTGRGVYGPGHCAFFRSPGETEDWIAYHANDQPNLGWHPRSTRMQRFGWNRDGTPFLGLPVAKSLPLDAPAGETWSPRPADDGRRGLLAEYTDPRHPETPRVRRLDPTLDFRWDLKAPAPTIPADFFRARWHGYVEPPSSDEYTFATEADDGVRVWIDGALVINDWNVHGPVLKESAPVRLRAGRKHSLHVEYFEYDRTAQVRLLWSSSRQRQKSPIPQSQLYPREP